MLSESIEQMIDPDPAKRPARAAHVAKSLRVFLAAEREQEMKAEEHIVAPKEHAVRRTEIQEEESEELDEEQVDEAAEQEERPRRRITRRAAAEEGLYGKAVAVWDELKPEVRDLLFLAGGALGMLLLIFLGEILTGIRLTYIAGLLTGAAVSYFVERFIRWRQQTKALEEGGASSAVRRGE